MTTQRRPRGADHHLAKLDNDKVVAILIACRCLGKSARETGKRFGIDERQVRRILAGTAWREAVEMFEQTAQEVGGYAALGAAVKEEMGSGIRGV